MNDPRSTSDLASWNPMLGDYSSEIFNSYIKPTDAEDFKKIKKFAQDSPSVPLENCSPTRGEKNLYLGNIPLSLTREGLKYFLCQAAPVKSLRICQPKDPGSGTTFGFATVSCGKDAETIIRQFNNYSFGTSKKLVVKLGLSSEERERRRERQREDEEFYLKLCKDADASDTATSDIAISDTATRDTAMRDTTMRDTAIDKKLANTNGEVPETKQSTAANKSPRLCICCGKAGEKQCARCKKCYCSRECQRVDWAKHQKTCLLVVASSATKSPVTSNGSVEASTKKNSEYDIDEDSLLIAVNNVDVNGDGFPRACDMKPQNPLDSIIKLVVYVVDGLVMKGQAVSETETTALLAMTEKLAEYMLESRDGLRSEDCEEGMLVVVDYNGDMSRAQVTKRLSSSGKAEVYFIDYGNKETCSISDLKPMPSFALDLPMQCRNFTLYDMPKDMDSNIMASLSEHLKELVLEKFLSAEVKSCSDGSYQLVVTGEDGKTSVNNSLLSMYKDLMATAHTTESQDKITRPESFASAEAIPEDSTSAEIEDQVSIDMPSQPLPEELDFKIIVTDVKSPSLFYAQIATADLSNLAELANISERLQELTSNNANFRPKQGEACVAFFHEDKMWYRASILAANEDGTVKVSYFDYGNCADIDTCFLRPMSDEFKSLPKQARLFSLAGVRSSSTDGHWTTEAVKLFKEKAIQAPCDVYKKGMVDGVCQLQVYFESEDCCADELLIKHGYAVAETAQMQKNEQQQSKQQEISQEQNIDEKHYQQSKQQENVQQKSITPVEVKTENVVAEIKAVEGKAKPVQRFSLSRRKVNVNEELRAAVVHVEDPGSFYVNIVEREAIERLMEYSEHLHGTTLSQLRNPSPGDSCCALYTDGDWYRAEVISTGTNECLVFFSDYGNESMIPMTSIMVMPDEVKTLPAQALRVKLHGVEPVADGKLWSDTAKKFFSGLINEKILMLKVVDVRNGLAVCSAVCEDDECDVAMKIIKAGVARPEAARKVSDDVVEDAEIKAVEAKAKPVERFSLSRRKVNVNEELRVAVVHVEDPGSFYVNIVHREAIEKLMEYSEHLHGTTLSQLKNPSPGDSCCALYTDGDWYRAEVISTGTDECLVFFCDYGNESVIPMTSIMVMPDEVKSLPAQAVRVKLHGVEPVADGKLWSDTAKKFFSGLINEKILMLKVVDVRNGLAVCSAVCEDDECDVAMTIINAGISRPEAAKKASDGVVKVDVADVKDSSVLVDEKPRDRHVSNEHEVARREMVKPVVEKELKKSEVKEEIESKVVSNAAEINRSTQNVKVAEEKISVVNEEAKRNPVASERVQQRSGFKQHDQQSEESVSENGGFGKSPKQVATNQSSKFMNHGSGRMHGAAGNGMSHPMHQQSTRDVQQTNSYGNAAFRGRESFGGARGGGTRDGMKRINTSGRTEQFSKQQSKLAQEKIPKEYYSGANIEFSVSHLKSLACFYIVDKKNQGNDKLPIATYANAKALTDISEGMLCATLIGGSYCRVLIEKVLHSKKVSVRLVDRGSYGVANQSSLKCLTDEDYNRPFHAVRCFMFNAGGLGKLRWTDDAVSYLAHKFELADGALKGVVRGERSGALMLSIHDPEDSTQFIIDDLVKHGFVS